LVKIPSVAVRRREKNEPVDVALVKEDEIAVKRLVKRLVLVLLVVEAEVKIAEDALIVVILALIEASVSIVAEALTSSAIVAVAEESLVSVEEAEVRSAIVAEDMVVVARETVPVAVRLPVAKEVAVAVPSNDVSVTVKEVNEGVSVVAIVDVPERRILSPAIK
jgi:hypothetical protein